MNYNYGLVYPSQDSFYNVDVTNNNFSRLADGIDAAKSGGAKSAVVVAAYNSKNPLKANADFTCGTGDCIPTLNSALEKVNEGGEILLLDGDYYIKTRLMVEKSVTIRGMGGNHSRINKHDDSTDIIMLYLSARNVNLKDIGIYTDSNASGSHGIFVVGSGSVIEGCRFKMNEIVGYDVYTNVYLSNLGGHVRINGCVFEKYNDDRYNILSDGNWSGVVYGNYCINTESEKQMDVKINLNSNESWQNMSFGAQKSKIYLGGSLKA